MIYRNIKGLITIGIIVILWSCASSLLPPAEGDATFAQKQWNDVTYAQLNEGFNLYKNKCGNCHYLYRPDKFSVDTWKKEILEMSSKIKLDSGQITLITRYILTARETRSFAKK